jgi:hypothetical protein
MGGIWFIDRLLPETKLTCEEGRGRYLLRNAWRDGVGGVELEMMGIGPVPASQSSEGSIWNRAISNESELRSLESQVDHHSVTHGKV